jgi:transcriptional regulator with XRE-family HTH domain
MTGRELSTRREKCGLTQEQLADYLCIGRTTVWRYENDKEEIKGAAVLLAKNIEIVNPTFNKYVNSLPEMAQLMIRRRQHKYNMKIALGRA